MELAANASIVTSVSKAVRPAVDLEFKDEMAFLLLASTGTIASSRTPEVDSTPILLHGERSGPCTPDKVGARRGATIWNLWSSVSSYLPRPSPLVIRYGTSRRGDGPSPVLAASHCAASR